jgi:hypothetical protein
VSPTTPAGRLRLLPDELEKVPRTGALGSVQAGVLVVDQPLSRILDREFLDRAAAGYWRFLSRVTLDLVRVAYAADHQSVVLIRSPLVLLRFRAPSAAPNDGLVLPVLPQTGEDGRYHLPPLRAGGRIAIATWSAARALASGLPLTGPQTGTQQLSRRRKRLGRAESEETAPCLENRFGPFRSDEGSNPSPSAEEARNRRLAGGFFMPRPPDLSVPRHAWDHPPPVWSIPRRSAEGREFGPP